MPTFGSFFKDCSKLEIDDEYFTRINQLKKEMHNLPVGELEKIASEFNGKFDAKNARAEAAMRIIANKTPYH